MRAMVYFIARLFFEKTEMKLSPAFALLFALLTSSCLLVLLTSNALLAHEGHEGEQPPPRINEAEYHKATVVPDRIVLTWTGNPAYTQDVSWRTSEKVKRSFVEFAVATKGPYFVKNTVRISASTAPFESNLGTYHIHTATMKSLAPSRKYVYRVGDGGNNWSEWFHFKTASTGTEPFKFIYFGDAQNDIRSMWSRIIREAHADAPRASFLLHAGDLINQANEDGEWGDWFRAGHWINAMMPSIATPGNHEYASNDDDDVRKLSRHWQPTFAFPSNGPKDLKETVYYLDYQGTRFISLNTNEHEALQADWVEQVLSKNPNRWTIITYHHPMYSSGQGRDNVELRKTWKPIFDKYKVDLVLQGHDHSYARTGHKLPEKAENIESGVNLKAGPTVYVVSVSGPKQYDITQRDYFKRSASGAQLYQIIQVTRDELHFSAHVANGELYDAFTLRKREGANNELIDRAPSTPESRKPITIQLPTKAEESSTSNATAS